MNNREPLYLKWHLILLFSNQEWYDYYDYSHKAWKLNLRSMFFFFTRGLNNVLNVAGKCSIVL